MNRNPSMAGLASLVQSRGRNGDTMLVHMTPGEVQGLQSLALAHGGSLTLNPDTGLYEANFLKKLLPTILGFGLNFLFPGLGALGSGLLVGAGETIRTGGDLGKGLMAGLGAFGGASLGAGLSSAAAKTAQGTASVGGAGLSSTLPQTTGIELASQLGTNAGGIGSAALETGGGAILPSAATTAGTTAAAETAKQGLFTLNPDMAGTFSNYGKGISALAKPAGREAFMQAVPGGQMGLLAGGVGVANAMTPEFKLPDASGQIDDSYYEGGDYDPATGTFKQGRWRKGYPGFPPTGMAMGGQVSPAPNYSYPQAGITKSNYAPSLEYMKPREILDGYDTKIDPFTGAEGFADGGEVGVAPEQNIQAQLGPQASLPQQSLEQYYQGLLSAPQAPAADPAFANYLQSLNKFVTSPVAPPPPPPKEAAPTTPTTPPTTPFNPNDFDFSNIDFNNFNFSNLSNYLQNNSDNRMVYDPVTGGFRQPGSQTVDTPPGQDMSSDYSGLENMPMITDMAGYGQEMPPGYQSTIPEFNLTPSDMTYGQAMAQGNLTDIGQFAEPSYDFAGGTQNFDMGDMPVQPQMGDMSGYGQQFQGFQSLPTDFGSTYQPPAMMAPSLDMTAYSQQPMDFGSMGNYGLGALGGGYQAPQFQMPSYDSSTPAFEAPTASYSAPMTTGYDSTGVSAPQYGFGNSDVMYGQSMLGGDESNVFGFAGGGAIQKAAAGKLVTGDGDGMSDDIRANINGDQEARLADGEFVIPADVVSHLGNGSTDAGADRLYSMMDRIRKARTGRKQQAPEIDAEKYLPA